MSPERVAITSLLVNMILTLATMLYVYFTYRHLKTTIQGHTDQQKAQKLQNRATTAIILAGKSDEINHIIIQHPGLWAGLGEPYNSETTDPSDRRGPLTDILLNLFEQVYLQYEVYDLIEQHDFDAWKNPYEENLSEKIYMGLLEAKKTKRMVTVLTLLILLSVKYGESHLPQNWNWCKSGGGKALICMWT
jgi:hypothetical protein